MRKPKEIPPLRQDQAADSQQPGDNDRIAWARELWSSQDWALQQRDRQVEENVRMLAGQQWTVYSDLLGKWIPVDEVLGDKERRWRQRPVVNRLLYWFMLTHARMTENPPVVSFKPATADREDARLAEAMDTIYKSLWDELDMIEVIDQWMAWLIPGGSAYLKSRVDLNGGDVREWYGPAMVQGPDGQETFVPIAPFNEQGEPQVEVRQGSAGELEFRFTGEPFVEREGTLAVDVLNPLEMRGEWGNDTPWHRKRWHIHRSYLTPEQVFDIYGVECDPTMTSVEAEGVGELERLLFGAGYFGAAENEPAAGSAPHQTDRGLVEINELWHAPTDAVSGMEARPDSPGGRLLVCTPNKVLFDGPRPVDLEYTSPIHKLNFVSLPGRPDGTSPQEMLNPIQRTYNRGVAQLMEHRNLTTNPVTIIDALSGIQEDQLTNKPGLILKNVQRRSGVPAIEFVTPPPLSDDVYRIQGMLQDEITYLGNLAGGSGQPQTEDPSGELVKELRFNSDRFVGPTMKRAVRVLSRVVEDWIAYLPTIWDEEKVIAYAGEDAVTRSITVLPEMFEDGSVNVHVDIESMLPEGRGERQKKIWVMYESGLFGEPGTPEARRKFFAMSRFPHLGRAGKPGGVDQVTAQQENGKLIQGIPWDQIPVLQTYDHEIHAEVHKQFINSPEFLEQPKPIQFGFMMHMKAHLEYIEQVQAEQLRKEMQQVAALASAQGEGGGVGGAPRAQQKENGGPGGERGQQGGQQNGGRPSRLTEAQYPG